MTQAELHVEIAADTAKGAAKVKRDLDSVGRAAKDATGDLKGMGKGAAGAQTSIAGLASSLVGPLGLAAGFATVGAAAAAAAKKALAFQESMAEIATLLPQGSEDVAILTENIKALSAEFGAMPVDTAKATYQIISAGATSAAEATDILTAANKLAIGGVTGVTTAADGLTTILNAWGKEASEATDVSDAMFSAMKAGKTTVGELSQSISYVASVAAQTGISLDEVLAATAALTKGGVPTNRAMRGLAQVIALTVKPASEAAKMAESLGLEFNAAALQAKGLSGFLQSVADATGHDTEKIAQLFGGVESLLPVLTLTGTGAQDFSDILGQMGTKAGQTEEAVRKITSTDAFQLDKARSEWEVFTTDVGSMIVRNILGPMARAATGGMELARETSSSGLEPETLSRLTLGVYQPGGRMRSSTDQMLSALSLGIYQPDRIEQPRAIGPEPSMAGPVIPFADYLHEQRGLTEDADRVSISDVLSSEELRLAGQEIGRILRESIAEDLSGPNALLPDDWYSTEDQKKADALASDVKDMAVLSKEWDAELQATGVTIADLSEPAESFRDVLEGVAEEFNALNGVLSRVSPKMANYADTVFKLASGDYFGAFVSGLNGIVNAFSGVEKSSTDVYAELQRVTSALESIKSASAGISRQVGGPAADAAREALLAPVRALYDDLAAFTETRRAAYVEDYGEVVAPGVMQASAIKGTILAVSDMSSQFEDSLTEFGFRWAEWASTAEVIFGTDDFADIAAQAFDNLATSVEGAGAAAKLASDQYAAAAQITLQAQFAEDIKRAGGDQFLQRQAYEQYQGTAASVHAQAALRASRGTSTGSSAVGGSASKVVASSGAVIELDVASIEDFGVTDFDQIIDMTPILDLDSAKIPVRWDYAIRMTGPRPVYNFKELVVWSDIIDMDYLNRSSVPDDRKIPVRWDRAIRMTGPRPVYNFKESITWADIMDMDYLSRSSVPASRQIAVRWDRPICMTGPRPVYNFRENVTWADVMDMDYLSREGIPDSRKIPVRWDSAINMTDKLPLSEWSDIFGYDRLPDAIPVSASDVVSIAPIEFTSWAPLFGFPEEYGPGSAQYPDPIRVNASDVLSVIPATVPLASFSGTDVSSMLKVDYRMQVDLDYLYRAGAFRIYPAQVRLSDLINIDSGDFGDLVVDAVQNGINDRKLR